MLLFDKWWEKYLTKFLKHCWYGSVAWTQIRTSETVNLRNRIYQLFDLPQTCHTRKWKIYCLTSSACSKDYLFHIFKEDNKKVGVVFCCIPHVINIIKVCTIRLILVGGKVLKKSRERQVCRIRVWTSSSNLKGIQFSSKRYMYCRCRNKRALFILCIITNPPSHDNCLRSRTDKYETYL